MKSNDRFQVDTERALRLLRREMKEKGISQRQLASELNLSTATINGYLAGEQISVKGYCAISRRYGVSVDYLLGFCDLKSNKPVVGVIHDATGLSEEAIEVLLNKEIWENFGDHDLLKRTLSRMLEEGEMFPHIVYAITYAKNTEISQIIQKCFQTAFKIYIDNLEISVVDNEKNSLELAEYIIGKGLSKRADCICEYYTEEQYYSRRIWSLEEEELHQAQTILVCLAEYIFSEKVSRVKAEVQEELREFFIHLKNNSINKLEKDIEISGCKNRGSVSNAIDIVIDEVESIVRKAFSR